MERTIVLSNEIAVNAAITAIRLNWQAAAQSGNPLAARIYTHKETRTGEQNRLMWVRLGEISDQAFINGQRFSAEVWAEHLKREFLPEHEGPSRYVKKGYCKWSILPNGERVLKGSTTQLTTAGFSNYMDQIMSYAAQELGVMFGATPEEERMYR